MLVEWQGNTCTLLNLEFHNHDSPYQTEANSPGNKSNTIWSKHELNLSSTLFVSGKVLTHHENDCEAVNAPSKSKASLPLQHYFVQYQKLKSFLDSFLCSSVEFHTFCDSYSLTVSGVSSLIMTFLVDPDPIFMFPWCSVMIRHMKCSPWRS